MPRNVTTAIIADDPQFHENQHVHIVYDEIASHFSSTRYKPWPIIATFLSNLPTGWVGLDSGTGNGKYLPLPLDRPGGSVWTIGLDRSRNLLDIAKTASGDHRLIRREVVCGDVLGNGWRPGAFDYAISIATIHHLASDQRRNLAIQRLIQCVSSTHGRILVYVWAVEQDELSKRSIPADETGQDVFIPWVLSQQPTGKESRTRANGANPKIAAGQLVFNRYYHMFAHGELAELVRKAAGELGLHVGSRDDSPEQNIRGLEIVQDGWERSNYFVELRRWER